MIRLFIADDHPLVRAGFRQLIAEDADVAVVGEAPDGHSLPAALRATPADVLVLDIGMPGPRFPEQLRTLRREFPDLRVLVVSIQPEGQIALRALEAGAAGYVSKTQSPTELLAAVRKVSSGGKYVSAALGERLAIELEARAGGNGRPITELSRREQQVLAQLAKGRSNKEIAAACRLSPKTVSTYRARLLRKLGLHTNADLVRYSLETGLSV